MGRGGQKSVTYYLNVPNDLKKIFLSVQVSIKEPLDLIGRIGHKIKPKYFYQKCSKK